MTIAIAATFPNPHAPARSAEGTGNGTSPVDGLNSGVDFASILLGLPVVAASLPLPDPEMSTSSQSITPEAGPTGADPQILATLGCVPMPPPGTLGTLASEEVDLPSPMRNAAPVIPPSAGIERIALPPALEGSSGKELPAPAVVAAAAEQPAKFAVAAFATPLPERAMPNQAETASAADNLSTLPVSPGQVVNGAALPHEIARNLPMPLHDSAWAGEFGQKLLWFANNDKQLAQLTLHPPQLGSIEVTLNMNKEGASAHFVSANADVRGAMETAVPRLREMFASAGIELGQVSIGSESFRQSDPQQEPSQQPRPPVDKAILGRDSAGGLPARLIPTQRGRGLIDTFA